MTMQFINVKTSTTKDVEITEDGVTVFEGSVTDNGSEQAWHDFIGGVYAAGIRVGVTKALSSKDSTINDRPS